VACGGGIVLSPAHRRLLRERCRVVWLEVDTVEAARRTAAPGSAGTRPLLAGGDPVARLRALERERAPLYAEAAGFRVQTSGRTPEQVAGLVLDAIGGA
jgi:shikimate kinase